MVFDSNHGFFSVRVNGFADPDEAAQMFFEALQGTKIETLVISEIGIGTASLTSFANVISDMTALNTITLDSTGDAVSRP